MDENNKKHPIGCFLKNPLYPLYSGKAFWSAQKHIYHLTYLDELTQ